MSLAGDGDSSVGHGSWSGPPAAGSNPASAFTQIEEKVLDILTMIQQLQIPHQQPRVTSSDLQGLRSDDAGGAIVNRASEGAPPRGTLGQVLSRAVGEFPSARRAGTCILWLQRRSTSMETAAMSGAMTLPVTPRQSRTNLFVKVSNWSRTRQIFLYVIPKMTYVQGRICR